MWRIVAGLAACHHRDGSTGETGAPEETDADVDADTDADVDADTDADAEPTGAVRFVNPSVDFGPAYLIPSSGTDPLLSVAPLTASRWTPFPAGPFDVVVTAEGQTKDQGAPVSAEVAERGFTTMWVVGTSTAPIVGAEPDDTTGLPTGANRWLVHDAIPDALSVEVTGPYADGTLALGQAVAIDGDAGGFEVAVRIDGGEPWTFTLPAMPAGTFVPGFVAWDGDALVLVGGSPHGGCTVLAGVLGSSTTP
jgi:hypothetical protein